MGWCVGDGRAGVAEQGPVVHELLNRSQPRHAHRHRPSGAGLGRGPRAPVAGRTPRGALRLLGARPPHAFRPTSALRRGRRGADPRRMGASEGTPRRLGGGRSRCPHCGLPRDRVATLGHEWVMLEPDLRPLAHEVPAGHRWIELSDGRVTVYGVCPPDPFQRCRIEHRLACPNRSLPDLWPWLTDRRSENARRGGNARRTERRHPPEPEPPPEEWPSAG
ncbi:DUF6083 domain-containing protein [Streptomyces murinus]